MHVKAAKGKLINFEHACFISYRHGQGEVLQGFMKQFIDALQSEIAMYSHLKIFLDKERLFAGTLLNKSLAQALCRSACMIMIYTPRYFEENSTYCTREFLAMKKLAKEREKRKHGQTRSFIIPVVLRGKETFPMKLFGNEIVIHCDFEKFDLTNKRIMKDARYYELIKQIAKHIAACINDFLHESPCEHCDQFDFPTEEDAQRFLKTLRKKQKKLPFK